MSLMPKILIRGELPIDALRLKYYPNLPTHLGGVLRCIASHHERATGAGNHQRGKNPEERCLTAAVRTQQAKQLRRTYLERDSIESGTVLVSMNKILNRNDGRSGSFFYFQPGVS